MKRLAPIVILAAAACACGMMKDDPGTKDIEKNVEDVEFKLKETRTLSNLAKIESSIASYVQQEKKIPDNLDALVPKYLAEVPTVELGLGRHRDTAAVKVYPSSVLVDGAVDGSKLRDSGRWGYVHNDRQVVIFVDCVHHASDGTPWYQKRGVY